jgi:hyperosmotically inducible protein
LRGHRNYELEELRSTECWSFLTPELLDSKLINSVWTVVNFLTIPFTYKEVTMKRSIVTFLKGILSVIVALVFFVTVSGCQKQEGTMEKAGKKVDEGIGEAKDSIKKAGEKVGEGVDKAKEAMQDAAQKAEEKAKE